MKHTKERNGRLLIDILLIIIGFVILIKGADLLVKAAISIAKRFGISEMLIGLTILAIGTSLPEIFITVSSAIDNRSDLIIGNAIGSCICNFLLVIGITSLIKKIKFDKRIIKRHLPIGIVAMILLLLLGNIQKFGDAQKITRGDGIALLLCLTAYIIYSVYEEKKIHNNKIDKELIEEVKSKENYSIITIIIYIILGVLGLKFGADFVVENSVLIANKLGLTEKFIGMTIIAIGTTLPEITTSIISARKDETDLLLGNISGSNIINLLLLIGLGAVINPLAFSADFNMSIITLIIVTIFLQIITTINKKNELDWKRGIILIIMYIIYICSMI